MELRGVNETENTTGYVINVGNDTGMIFFIVAKEPVYEKRTVYTYQDRAWIQKTRYYFRKVSNKESSTELYGDGVSNVVEYVKYIEK